MCIFELTRWSQNTLNNYIRQTFFNRTQLMRLILHFPHYKTFILGYNFYFNETLIFWAMPHSLKSLKFQSYHQPEYIKHDCTIIHCTCFVFLHILDLQPRDKLTMLVVWHKRIPYQCYCWHQPAWVSIIVWYVSRMVVTWLQVKNICIYKNQF